jgi:hypothetical protein
MIGQKPLPQIGRLVFTVLSPQATFPKLPMGRAQITFINGVQALQLFGALQGVTFQPTVTTPTINGKHIGGHYGIIQLATPKRTGIDPAGAPVYDSSTGLGEGLDNQTFYGILGNAQIWSADDPHPVAVGDSPGIKLILARTKSVTVQDSFVDTLMYRCGDQSNSCYVPLLVSTWNWGASASYTVQGDWKITDPSDPTVPFDTQTVGVPTTKFPHWTRIYKNWDQTIWKKS